MRSLALARYRLLNGVRSADWVYGLAVFCVLVPMVGAAITAGVEWLGAGQFAIRPFAVMFSAIYIIHALILAAASQALVGPKQVWGEYVQVTDLFEAAPVDPRTRFVGEAVGIAVALAVIHLSTLPVITFGWMLSPQPWKVFAGLEAAVLVLIVFFSVVGAATGREVGSAWKRTRAPRAVGSVAFLVLGALAVTTRPRAFRDALGDLLAEASPRAWTALVSTVHNPLLLQVLLCAIFFGTIAYFYLRAADPIEAGDYR
ncbi:MAG: hypothetical protein WA208_01050 [Thermoanaerobaculia bacterium]